MIPQRLLFFSVILVAAAMPLIARAELILDDFDDPAQLQLPEMKFDTVQTTAVGALVATRRIDVSTGTRPVGVFAADSLIDSALAAQFGMINPDSTVVGRFVDLTFIYNFSFVDATQGGVNDGILLDFRSFDRGKVLASLDVFATDDVTGRHNTSTPLPDSAGPFVVAIPFSAFTRRDQRLHADQLQGLSFRIRLTVPGPVPEMDFNMALDRVRIGQVPEPAARRMSVFAAAALLICGTRRRKRGSLGDI